MSDELDDETGAKERKGKRRRRRRHRECRQTIILPLIILIATDRVTVLMPAVVVRQLWWLPCRW